MVLDSEIILSIFWLMIRRSTIWMLWPTFVNIGSDLAEKIPDQGSSEHNMEKLISRNEFFMFLTAVDEREIVDIV